MADASRTPGDVTIDREAPDTADGAGNSADATSSDNEPDELPLDQVFEILKNARRRHVLRYLRDAEGTVKLGELAEHVAAIENNTTVEAVTSEQRKRVYVGLYQCHLPKMDDMDVVDFNQDRGRITLGPTADQIEEYLDLADSEPRNWERLYSGVAGSGIVLLALSYALPAGIGLTPAISGGLVTIALAALAGYHTYEAN